MISINNNFKWDKSKIAGFDLDNTIIKPKSGKVFPKDKNDWTFLYDIIPEKLKELSDNGYGIVIFSNQLGISKKNINVTKEDITFKINEIIKKLNIPVLALVSTNDDEYRKPRIGLWKYLKKNNKIKINKKESFYVGDMAGRIKIKKIKKDKTDSDRKFSINIGIKFYTPEEFFLDKQKESWKLSNYLLDCNHTNTEELNFTGNKIMILINGYPASGKSYLAKKINNFTLISKDLFKNKIIKILTENLENEKNVIIEGLLYNYDKRKIYINLANKYNYKIIFINMKTSLELSYHMNIYRSLNDSKNKIIPKVVYYTFRKYYEEPNKKYFSEIINYHPSISKKINKYFLY